MESNMSGNLLCKFFGHKFSEWEYVVDNSSEGVRICRRCGHKEEQDIPHKYGEVEYENSGECEVCGGYGPAFGVCPKCGAKSQTT